MSVNNLSRFTSFASFLRWDIFDVISLQTNIIVKLALGSFKLEECVIGAVFCQDQHYLDLLKEVCAIWKCRKGVEHDTKKQTLLSTVTAKIHKNAALKPLPVSCRCVLCRKQSRKTCLSNKQWLVWTGYFQIHSTCQRQK